MSVVIYHNPDCGTSRNTLAILHAANLFATNFGQNLFAATLSLYQAGGILIGAL